MWGFLVASRCIFVLIMTLLDHRNTATTKKLDFKNSHLTSVGARRRPRLQFAGPDKTIGFLGFHQAGCLLINWRSSRQRRGVRRGHRRRCRGRRRRGQQRQRKSGDRRRHRRGFSCLRWSSHVEAARSPVGWTFTRHSNKKLLIFDSKWSQNSLFTAKMRIKTQAFLSKVNRENQALWLGFFCSNEIC
jgi:hypothetical protein